MTTRKCYCVIFLFLQFHCSKTIVDDDTLKRDVIIVPLFMLCAKLQCKKMTKQECSCIVILFVQLCCSKKKDDDDVLERIIVVILLFMLCIELQQKK
jgi:hypothetical protein